MDGLSWRVAVLCLILPVLVAASVGCSNEPPPTYEEVVGTYRGTFVTGEEQLQLKVDGTYDEIRKDELISWQGKTIQYEAEYRNSGKWTYWLREGKVQVLVSRALIYDSTQPPVPLDYRFTAIRRGGDLVLDAGDPDGVIVLKRVP